MNNKSAIALAVVGVLFAANSVCAQPTGYIGASIGQSDVDVSGYDQATSFQLFGGMSLSQYFGLEVAYTNLGEFDNNSTLQTVEVDGFELTAVGSFPVTNHIDLFGEAGLYAWNMDITATGLGSGSDDGTDLTYGVGAKFQVAQPLKLHVEYQRYNNIDDEDIDTIYGGLAFSF